MLVGFLTIQLLLAMEKYLAVTGNAVSYAVSVENISIQLDATMNNGWGAKADTTSTPNVAEDKNVDAVELGVSMGLGENGNMAFAHKNHDSMVGSSKKSNYIAAEYSIGAMTAYLDTLSIKPRIMKRRLKVKLPRQRSPYTEPLLLAKEFRMKTTILPTRNTC